MQGMNMEVIKTFEGPPPKSGPKQNVVNFDKGAFREAVKKAITGKSEQFTEQKAAAVTTDTAAQAQTGINDSAATDFQLSELIAMMTGATVTVPLQDFEGKQAREAKQPQETGEKQAEKAPAETIPKEIYLQETGRIAGDQPGRIGESTGPGPHEARQMPPPQERPVVPPQPQSTHGAEPKEPLVKEKAESEKPAPVKQGEQFVKTAELKQDTTKELKQEFAGQLKQQVPVDPEKVYVKVGEGNKLDSQKFASDVSDKIAAKFSEGVKQFEIELTPRELGKIVIKLMMLNGKAEVIIQCFNPKTQQLVLANTDIIRNIIEERTGANTTITVKESEEARDDLEHNGKQQNQDEQEQQQSDSRDEAETVIFLNQLRLGLIEELKT